MTDHNCPYCNQPFSDSFIDEINQIEAEIGFSEMFYDTTCCKKEMTCYFYKKQLFFKAKTQKEHNRELYELSDDFFDENKVEINNEAKTPKNFAENNLFLIKPIVFEDYVGKNMTTFSDDLNDFLLGNQEKPLSEIIKKGAQSLREGYYKILEVPFLRPYNNGITTHAARVLFYKEGYKQPISYLANVGPLMNYEAKYNDDSTGVWLKFIKNGVYADKHAFFNDLMDKEFIVLKDESVISQKFGNVKKITWRFN